jgi:NADPH:quinone reductase-like Zn-dependent oxidoreductase
MRAAVCTEYGPPESVRIADWPQPAPGPGQVLIAVRTSTVNRTDAGTRLGHPAFARAFTGLRRPRAAVLGCEYAGEVVALGDAVTSLRVGDRVFGYNEGAFGAHAEYVVVAADGPIATIPEAVRYEQAAPATEGAHYAWAFLRKARVRPGQSVLVNGATGAIGSAAVQLLRSLDVTVTAVCEGAHAELVTGLGADRVIDYTVTDFTADPERFDAVFDAVGKSSFGACRGLLQPDGVYVSSELGPGGQNLLLAMAGPLMRGRTVRFPFPRIDQQLVQRFAGMLAAATFRPVVDRSYPLEEIVAAYRYVESGQKLGSVLLDVAGTGDISSAA